MLPAVAQIYTWTNFAGQPGLRGAVDGTGAAASFTFPSAVAVDASGNVYVADFGNNTIRKITPAGVVTTLAGSPGIAGSTDGTGSAALFNTPIGVAVDASGNVYVSDRDNYTVRKISPAGNVTTLAGSAGIASATDGTGDGARFVFPGGIAVDASGNVYVGDGGTLRKITSAGVVTTLAGSNTAPPGGVYNDGIGSAAHFDYLAGLAVDTSGNVYGADYSACLIRKITPAGVVTTLAGSSGMFGSTDGVGSAARFSFPAGIAVDASGNVYVGDVKQQYHPQNHSGWRRHHDWRNGGSCGVCGRNRLSSSVY